MRKVEIIMAQFVRPEPERPVPTETTNVSSAISVASPAPLGLSMLAFTTALVGCFYAGFIIPYGVSSIRTAVGVFLLVGGIILILAGMWEFRKNYLMTSTTFTSYGGFLAALGILFMPNFGIQGVLAGSGYMHLVLGLFFLCWTIFTGVLWVGATRTNVSMLATLGLLFIAFLFLTIGQLADGNIVLLIIGGWFAIACAIVAWLSSLASILSSSARQGNFKIPMGKRLAVVE